MLVSYYIYAMGSIWEETSIVDVAVLHESQAACRLASLGLHFLQLALSYVIGVLIGNDSPCSRCKLRIHSWHEGALLHLSGTSAACNLPFAKDLNIIIEK